MVASAQKPAKNRRCDFYQTLERRTPYFPPGEDGKHLPDIFVYLKNDDDRVCFARLNATDCMDPLAKAKWIRFLPDKALGKVKNDWEGGYVLLRTYVGVSGDSDHTLETGNWTKQPSPPPLETKTLVCNLFQAKNLPSADSNALADPYVRIYCGGDEV